MMHFETRPELELIANSLKSLKQDGIIRTKNLVGDLGEFYSSKLFDLTLNDNVVNSGYDAKDKNGKRVEIKTRRTPKASSKLIFRSFDFDYCLYIELNEYFEPVEVIKVTVYEILKFVDKKGDRLSVMKLKTKTINEKVF